MRVLGGILKRDLETNAGGLRRDAGGGQEGCCCRVRDLGGCCREGVQMWTHQHRLLSRAGLCDAEGHPPLTEDAYHPWGKTTPPPLTGLPPLSGSAKQRGGSLIFPRPSGCRGCGNPCLGCLHHLFALGVGSFIALCPGTELAWPGRMVCCNFGCFWLRRERNRGHRTWRKGQQLVQPSRWGFQSA